MNNTIIYNGKQYDKSKVKTNRTIFQILGGVLFIASICCFFAIAIGAFLFTLIASWVSVFIAYRYEKILKYEKPVNQYVAPLPTQNTPNPGSPIPQPLPVPGNPIMNATLHTNINPDVKKPSITNNIQTSNLIQASDNVQTSVLPPSEGNNTPLPTEQRANLPDYDEEYCFKATGTSFRDKDILSLLCENDIYTMSKKELIENYMTDEPIYKYETAAGSAELIPEPENEYDSNAIAIYLDNIHIGYVPAKKCSKVKKLLDSDSIAFIFAEITGDPYKIIEMNEEGNYSSSNRNHSFSVNITLCIKNH